MAFRILVIDDEPDLLKMLEFALRSEGYEVDVALDGREGLKRLYGFRPDLIILDVMMPQMSGWETLERIRQMSDVPVIMLTAVDRENDKVQGLDLGADDYVTKPFALKELKARVRALLRRADLPAARQELILILDFGDLVLDLGACRVTVRGELVDLSPTEQRLLFFLARNVGQVVPHSRILEAVWGPGYEDSSALVKVYIQRLRSKIEPQPASPRYILTQRGLGYYLAKEGFIRNSQRTRRSGSSRDPAV